MKLNHRILLLIAPVILLSSAVSSYIIYDSQKEALIKRVDSYLQLDMEKLASQFRQTKALLSSYSFTLANSDIIRHYFDHSYNPYRELELADNIEKAFNILKSNEQDSVAITLLNGNKDILYFADNSDDPFSKMDPTVFKYVKNRFNQTLKTSDISYTENSSGEGILIRYDVLDTKTLETPLSYNRDKIFFIVVYVALNEFNSFRHKLEYDNQSPIFFSKKPQDTLEGLTHSVELQPGMYATLSPAPMLLRNKLNEIRQNLVGAFGSSAFFTVSLLLFLLYRHVITPISRLDKQLQEVESKTRNNIEKLDSNDEIGRLSQRFYDMYNELDTTYQQTKTLAEYDHLTQLANRYQFKVMANKACKNASNYRHIEVLYIDLDNFKYVNDKYGHQVGDALLVNFASHVSTLCDEFTHQKHVTSVAARLSGDEFAILLCAPKHSDIIADEFSQRLLQPIRKHDDSPLGRFPITASIGIATYPMDGEEIEALLINADTAMYQAKNAGKNQIAHYSKKLDNQVQRRIAIERALRLENFDQEFSLVYQPYFTSKEAEIAGFEVLLRWKSDLVGQVSPDEFIPIAEQTGLFEKIDRWVIEHAFAQFPPLWESFDHPVHLSINLSSAGLNSLELAEFIQLQSKKYRISPCWIDFEITETFAADSKTIPLLHTLAENGYGLTIDDFGSGYTSIAQLVQYPINKIKFDQKFIEVIVSAGKQSILEPLIQLCHSQSMKVTAEGVEDQKMRQWLTQYQCDYIQGFFFGEPMSLEQIQQWYNSETKVTHEQSNHCLS